MGEPHFTRDTESAVPPNPPVVPPRQCTSEYEVSGKFYQCDLPEHWQHRHSFGEGRNIYWYDEVAGQSEVVGGAPDHAVSHPCDSSDVVSHGEALIGTQWQVLRRAHHEWVLDPQVYETKADAHDASNYGDRLIPAALAPVVGGAPDLRARINKYLSGAESYYSDFTEAQQGRKLLAEAAAALGPVPLSNATLASTWAVLSEARTKLNMAELSALQMLFAEAGRLVRAAEQPAALGSVPEVIPQMRVQEESRERAAIDRALRAIESQPTVSIDGLSYYLKPNIVAVIKHIRRAEGIK